MHEITPLGVDGAGGRTALTAAQVEALHLVLDAELTAERDRLAQYVPSLAVIGSASPLLGLFGTVLGVISAFTGIAVKGSGNLGAVAPGVAEALTATAAALAVAVPTRSTMVRVAAWVAFRRSRLMAWSRPDFKRAIGTAFLNDRRLVSSLPAADLSLREDQGE